MNRPKSNRSYARQSVDGRVRRLAPTATATLSGLLTLLTLTGQCVAEERQSGTPYVITLRRDARVASGVIRLADVAQITGPSRSICERLGMLDLDDAPAAGDVQNISPIQVQFRLHLTGIKRGAYRVQGTVCAVRTAAVRPVSFITPSEPQQQNVVQATYDTASKSSSGNSRDRLQAMLAEQLRQLAARSPQKTQPAGLETVNQPQLQEHENHGRGSSSAGHASRVSTVSPREQVAIAARNAVLDRLPWERDDVRIDVTHVGLKASSEALVRHGALTPEIRSAWPPLGRVQVVIRAVGTDSTEAAEIPVVLNVRYFQNVVVAKRRINRGAVFSHEDVYLDRQEVRDLSGILTSSESVVGMTAGRDILPLNLIRPGDVKSTASIQARKPVIRRGATVNLIARGSGLAITVLCEAMQDGRPGDVIRVKNLDSQQIRTGKVINANEVEVNF